ncbi:hypothetical protein [Cellulophaga sp. L1A9]|uniref:hypothetical protein n=1 Tax=Cellulophaga sp. L1A9 TaxID=2686362 RepID=UPI00131BC364|nr:hypothetical protein [Cellulophaga sp. L1A9]
MRNLKLAAITVSFTLLLASCLSTEEKKIKAEEEGNALVSIKSKLIKGAGDALKTDGKEALESASEGLGEAFKGLTSGYDKSINQAKVLSDTTFLKTFEIGRTEKFYSDTTHIKKVTVYLIADKAFDKKLKLKAFDATDREIGRSTVATKIEEDDAQFIDFEFDNRTPLLQADYFIISHN